MYRTLNPVNRKDAPIHSLTYKRDLPLPNSILSAHIGNFS